MKLSFRCVLGAFRLVARRSAEVAQPGVGLWAGEGERVTRAVQGFVRDVAHKDEIADLEAAKEIAAGLQGLRDGRVDPEDLAHLERAGRLVKQSAELAHDLGEVAA